MKFHPYMTYGYDIIDESFERGSPERYYTNETRV